MVTQKKIEKSRIRSFLKAILQKLSNKRREEAAENAYDHLLPILSSQKGYVLSFLSMTNEISTRKIHSHLLQIGKLVLPKTVDNKLDLHYITDLKKQVSPHPKYPLLEPDPTKTLLLTPEKITLALIPGLGFDKLGYRIGYGKGFYDRLLQNLRCETYGLGFLEQLVENRLPTESHDLPLKHIALY